MEQKSEDWQYATQYLKDKPNGTKLSYNALWDEQSQTLVPRKKYKHSFLNGSYQHTASFIKINDIIYQIAQGQKPDALLGKGKYAKCKFMSDKDKTLSTLKVDKKLRPLEYKVLQDRGMTQGQNISPHKDKVYTQMDFLGTTLHLLLTHYPVLCNQKPPESTIALNLSYLYLNKGNIECMYTDANRVLHEITLSPKSLGKHFDFIKNKLNSPSLNFFTTTPSTPYFPYMLCENRPEDWEITPYHLSLYIEDHALKAAYRTHFDASPIRIEINTSFDSYARPNPEYAFKIYEMRPKTCPTNTFAIYCDKGFLHYAYRTQADPTLNRFKIPKTEAFYKNIKDELNQYQDQLITQPIHEEALAKAIYQAIGYEVLSLEEDKRLDIAIATCLDLAYLHEALGYVHRDLKPENIVVDSKGKVRLIDYGLSALNTEGIINNLESVCGSPLYVPYFDAIEGNMSLEDLDVFALKRILFFPTSFYYRDGYFEFPEPYQREQSLLTKPMIEKYQLSPYIETCSRKEDPNFHTKSLPSARALAAMLIVAKLKLKINYQDIVQDKELAYKITSDYDKEAGTIQINTKATLSETPKNFEINSEAVTNLSYLLKAQTLIENPKCAIISLGLFSVLLVALDHTYLGFGGIAFAYGLTLRNFGLFAEVLSRNEESYDNWLGI